jgi:Recombinase zinc beta ribbon domain
LPRRLIDRAREMVVASKRPERSRIAREWELRSLIRCRCGWRMRTHSALHRNGTVGYYYYACNKHDNYGRDTCPQKLLRAEEVEASVWGFVSGLLKDPDRIRSGTEALIENERGQLGGDPAREAVVWVDKLEECARLRKAYQRQQGAGLMSLAELGDALEELGNDRKTAEDELAPLKNTQERIEEL